MSISVGIGQKINTGAKNPLDFSTLKNKFYVFYDMRTSTQILPGVKAIGWLDCRHLPRRVDLTGICRMPLPVLTDIHWFDFFGEPECRCKSKKENGGYQDTASLKFRAAEALPHGVPCGFVVTDVNDKSYLIGSLEAPHPQVEPEQSTGSTSGDAAGYLYEIKHVALKSLIPCTI